jgi:subtilisin family serine protease
MKFLIEFKNSAQENNINLYLQRINAKILQTFNIYERVYLVEVTETPPVEEIVDKIIDDENSPLSLMSLPQIEIRPQVDDDWWKLVVFKGSDPDEEILFYDRKGDNTIVYIVDSGVKKDHQEFESTTIQELYSFNNDFNDYNGHGTALASLVSGKNCGITSATIKSVKIFQDGTPTLQSHLLAAFDAIAADVSKNADCLHIVNLSWGIPRNEYIESKIRSLIGVGLYVVVAAGNSGSPIENVTPACMPEVITVGSFGQELEPSNFSNYTGPLSVTTGTVNYGQIDVWSPGEQIKIATIDGNYSTSAGTSLSSAIHTAVLAYNSYMLESPDNRISSAVYNEVFYNTKSFSMFTSSISNLLHLSDSYSNSPNIISSCYHSSETGFKDLGLVNIAIRQTSGVETATLYPAYAISSIEFADPLPEGFTLEFPWIIGKRETDTYFIWESTAYVKYKSGVDQHLPAFIYVTNQNLTENSENLDPEIKIKLFAGCSCANCGGTCVSGFGAGCKNCSICSKAHPNGCGCFNACP